MLSELDLAYATYSAMQEPPGFVYIAERLMSTSGGVRKRLVEKTPPDILEKALAYLASPEALRERERRMEWMRADPVRITMLKVYYRANLADFIHDWGVTSDPREIAVGKMALVPFHLWPKQREAINWMIGCWKRGVPASLVKGRDVGASWCAMALLSSWCIFEKSFAGGIGSATEMKLDRSGDPDTLMWKAREFLKHLPEEFRGGYDDQKNSHYLRLTFPETGSSITGEAGDNIGRGGRKAAYIIDEAAFLDRPQLVDASLSMNTNFRLDISTPHGVNSFFDRVHNPALERFDLTWRDDPRKDRAWYEKKKSETDPVVFAQEIDASFYASAEGILIPPQWVQAAVNLFAEMNIEPTGLRTSALDVADLGKDRCAWIFRNGNNIEHAVSWTGTGSDIHGTAAKAFVLCDMYGVEEMVFDANGVGAGVRAAARVLNEERIARGQKPIVVLEYVSSNTPLFPDRIVPGTNRKAKDMFLNRAAQSAWHLRGRFENAYKARNGEPYDAENLIGVNSAIPELSRMIAEFSQPQVKETASGKWQLVKTPAGTRSPNFYDSIAMGFSIMKRPMFITEDVLVRAARAGSDMLAAVLGAGERGA